MQTCALVREIERVLPAHPRLARGAAPTSGALAAELRRQELDEGSALYRGQITGSIVPDGASAQARYGVPHRVCAYVLYASIVSAHRVCGVLVCACIYMQCRTLGGGAVACRVYRRD